MNRIPFTTVVLFFLFSNSYAQIGNDVCLNAIQIEHVSNYCSLEGEFSNIGATVGEFPADDCFETIENKDVWFSFVAVANAVNIVVRGKTEINARGTIEQPIFTLYKGSCENLVKLDCTSNGSFGTASNISDSLMIGQRYFIQVSARTGNEGTFQLCVNNFNLIPVFSSDCSTATLLCDKNTISVPSVGGGRGEAEDLQDEDCEAFNEAVCIIEEFNSYWYKWTCANSGNLSFNIVPDNLESDIDFMLFRLPNGIEDCDEKVTLRCMASGANLGSPLSDWESCTGATGIKDQVGDLSEFCGCNPGDDNFVDAIEVQAGESYALVIMNFSNDEAGFTLEFGGTTTFQSPEVNFVFDGSLINAIDNPSICLGKNLTITDSIVSEIGMVSEWYWRFGEGATLGDATGKGPHQTAYNSVGTKQIELVVGIDSLCYFSQTQELEVLAEDVIGCEIVSTHKTIAPSNKFILYPNSPDPASNFTQIQFQLPISTRISLVIYDVRGRPVAEIFQNTQFTSGNHQMSIPTSDLPHGIYTIALYNEFIRLTERMIISK